MVHYSAYNRLGDPVTKVGDDFLQPIADSLSLLVDDMPIHIRESCNTWYEATKNTYPWVGKREHAPVWLCRMQSCVPLPREEVLKSLEYPVGHVESPFCEGDHVEAKLDEMRCYMVVGDRNPVGFDLGLFTNDKYHGFKGKAVIHDIPSFMPYQDRKHYLENRAGFCCDTRLDRYAGGHMQWRNYPKSPCDRTKSEISNVFVNIGMRALGKNVLRQVEVMMNEPVIEGIVIKHRDHVYGAHSIHPQMKTKKQKWNMGEWSKLRWLLQ